MMMHFSFFVIIGYLLSSINKREFQELVCANTNPGNVFNPFDFGIEGPMDGTYTFVET